VRTARVADMSDIRRYGRVASGVGGHPIRGSIGVGCPGHRIGHRRRASSSHLNRLGGVSFQRGRVCRPTSAGSDRHRERAARAGRRPDRRRRPPGRSRRR
jgi:hypothetical protein